MVDVARTAEANPAPVRYFYRMEPLQKGVFQRAWVELRREHIRIAGAQFTVAEALELRAWLNSVLPL